MEKAGAILQSVTGIEPAATAILDVRSMPLAMLTSDVQVFHMVSKILDRMDEPSRVNVAKFNSSI